MAAGTAVGGWRIIKTLGHKMVKLHPINGFAAEASSATVIAVASIFGIPVSTTHNISAAIMGVGSAKRFNAIKWSVVERMVSGVATETVSINSTEFGQTPALGVMVVSHDNPSNDETQLIPVKLH